MLKLLVFKGANVNLNVSKEFGSPLFLSCLNNFESISSFLLEHGADPFQTSPIIFKANFLQKEKIQFLKYFFFSKLVY